MATTMKITDKWTTVMGTKVFVTDQNKRYILNRTQHTGPAGTWSVEAYQDDPQGKLGQAYVPADTPIEQWDQAISEQTRR